MFVIVMTGLRAGGNKCLCQCMNGRFAPSTTGHAHPGTLLSGLLAWLDARSRGMGFVLRLENLDKERCRPEFARAVQEQLQWFGLDWDELVVQSDLHDVHARALDQLAEQDRLYPCACSRKRIAALGVRAPDDGFAYDNHCQDRKLPTGGWRACTDAIRARLPDGEISLLDERGAILSQNPRQAMGDPIVVRKDGAVAYQLAVVTDDAHSHVARIIRGRDIAPSTATQVQLHALLGLTTPTYLHHLLFLEATGAEKLAKLHKSLPLPDLQNTFSPDELCREILGSAGFWGSNRSTWPQKVSPRDVISEFSWDRISRQDCTLHLVAGQKSQ